MNSVELFAACQNPNPSTRTQAYQELWQYLYQIARYMVQDQPEPDMIAQDCAQLALVRIHERLDTCREPAAFRVWARRIVSHLVVDELRRRKRLVLMPESDPDSQADHDSLSRQLNSRPPLEVTVMDRVAETELRNIIQQAPISDRSRRVVVGRYLDSTPDETLAQTESLLAERTVLPSHVQVTRAKNLAKLRKWDRLQEHLGITN